MVEVYRPRFIYENLYLNGFHFKLNLLVSRWYVATSACIPQQSYSNSLSASDL